jgi:hypothetical protein
VVAGLAAGLPASAQAVALPTDQAALAMNGRGDYLIAWPDYSLDRSLVVSAGSLLTPFPAPPSRTGDPGAQPPSVAVAADGTRAIAWFDQPPTAPVGDLSYAVDVAISLPGSSRWTIQQVAAPALVDAEGPPLVAFGRQDQAILAWAVTAASHARLVASWRPPGGEFGPPTTLYREASLASVADVGATFDGRGGSIVAFDRGSVGCAAGDAACRPVVGKSFVAFGDAAGRFGSAAGIIGCEEPELAEAPSGAAAIAIACVGAQDAVSVRVAERRAGARFGSFRRVSGVTGSDDYAPSVGVARSGVVTVAWLHRRRRGGEAVEFAAARIGASLSKPAALAGPGGSPGPPRVVVDPRGRTYVAFEDRRSILFITRIVANRAVGAGQALSPPGAVGDQAQVAIAGDGRGIAVYGLQSGAQAAEFRTDQRTMRRAST